MGARVYIPVLGRFLQVDPVEDGGDNAYAYVNDPVNEDDLDGKIAPLIAFAAWQLGRIAVQQVVKYAVKQAAKQAVQQVAKKSMVHSVKKIPQKAAPKKVGFVDRIATSQRFGTTSKLFGNNKFVNPAGYGKFTPGRWNMPGRSVKVGWSNYNNRYVFRVGIGKKSPTSNVSKYHINVLKGGRIRGW